MENIRTFDFDRTLIEKFHFSQMEAHGKLKHEFSIKPEFSEEDTRTIRIKASYIIKDTISKETFFEIKTFNYFYVSEKFGSFEPDGDAEKAMIEVSYKELEFYSASILRNTLGRYNLKMDFS